MAKPKVEIQIPKDLGLTRTQVSELQKGQDEQDCSPAHKSLSEQY